MSNPAAGLVYDLSRSEYNEVLWLNTKQLKESMNRNQAIREDQGPCIEEEDAGERKEKEEEKEESLASALALALALVQD